MRPPSVKFSLAIVMLYEWAVAGVILRMAYLDWLNQLPGNLFFGVVDILAALTMIGFSLALVREYVVGRWAPFQFLHFMILACLALAGAFAFVCGIVSPVEGFRWFEIGCGLLLAVTSALAVYLLDFVIWTSYRRQRHGPWPKEWDDRSRYPDGGACEETGAKADPLRG